MMRKLLPVLFLLLLPVLAFAQTEQIDDVSKLAAGVSRGVAFMCVNTSDSIDASDFGAVRCGATRQLIVEAIQSGTWNVGTLTSITNPVAVTGTFWQATQPVSGTVTANAGSGTFAVSGPLTDTQLRATAVPVSGTFWQATQPVSAASLPLPTGAATSANQSTAITALQLIDNLPVAQGSTTSGQSGALAQGAVTTADPTYTTGQTSPLSLTTDGKLRVAGSFSGGGDGALQDGVTPSIEATVFDYTNSNPLGVVLRDTNGDYVSVGGGTQYADGAAQATPTGTVALGHDGSNVRAVTTDAAGDLQIDVVTMPAITGTVTANAGTNLNTSALLTTTAHDNAFGTAGAADAQVRSIQGIAGGTAVPVSGTVTVTDGAGALNVIVDSGAVTVSGTVTANAGTGTLATDPTDEDARVLGRAKIHDGTDTALVSGTGSLQVTCDNCGGSTFSDNGAFTGGSTAVLPIAALYDATPPTVTDGSAGIPRMSSTRVLLVDGSGATQPVSGTVTANAGTGTFTVSDGAGAMNTIVDSGTLTSITNAVTVAQATAANLNATVTDGSGALTVDGTVTVTATNLDVQIGGSDSLTIGTFPDNEPINVAQMNGVAVTMGNGISGTGVQRVTLASDGTGQLSTVTTVGTVTNLANLPNEGQQTAANSISVTPDTDNDAIGAAGVAPPGEYVAVAGIVSGATGGFLGGIPVCDTFVNVNVSTATTTLLITGVSGRHARICSLSLVTAAANNVALISGTGATCGTGTTGMNGGTTAGAGWNFAANGGLAQGSGIGTINQTNATGDSVCIVTSAATQLSGRISYTIY